MPGHGFLDAYFARIGYRGPRAATLDVLKALHAAHPAAIPFENLDSLMGRVPALDIESLRKKILEDARGGYCYEQNGLFAYALREIGFNVTGLAARSLWSMPPGVTNNPRTHMLLRVDLPEGPHIADVGFGGLTLTAPLRLAFDIEQKTPYATYRLIRAEDEIEQQALIGGEWRKTYRFSQLPQLAEDYEAANWVVSTKPGAIMRVMLMAARSLADTRYTLANNRFHIYRNGEKTERLLRDAAEIENVLGNEFGIVLPADRAGLRSVLEKILRGEAY